jgi:hypothetical protein
MKTGVIFLFSLLTLTIALPLNADIDIKPVSYPKSIFCERSDQAPVDFYYNQASDRRTPEQTRAFEAFSKACVNPSLNLPLMLLRRLFKLA